MKLQKLIEKLHKLQEEHGSDIEVMYDDLIKFPAKILDVEFKDETEYDEDCIILT